MRVLMTLASLVLASLSIAHAETPTADSAGVARAVFATEIRDREPVGEISILPSDQRQIFFFTELLGLEGQTITHRWQYDGETMAEVEFQVRGPRWRVYSSKSLLPGWAGRWTVSVVTESGRVLHEDAFAYAAPSHGEPGALPASRDSSD